MEHSRHFGRALMSSIQRTPIAAGVSLRGIRGAPASLKPFEMVREAVLAESGRRVSQPACPAPAGDIRAGPVIRHMQCSPFGRGAPVALAPARARSMGWCHVADDAGVARATDRSSAQRDIDRGSRAAAGRRHQLQPRDASASRMLRRCRPRRANAIAPSRQDTSNGSGPGGDVRRCHPHDRALRLR